VLDVVDRARDWSDLYQRLAAHGVVVKLVRRGERVQGLAFAEGLDRNAPGCAASRIDARCALRAMESRFGPFPHEAQQRLEHASEQYDHSGGENRSRLRERAEREARTDPRWALIDAERIANHARLRSEYRSYRDRFFAERGRAISAQRNAAWERERAHRQRDAQARREARLLLREAARLGARGLVVRQLAYWSIDLMMGRRRAHEYRAAHVRWQATKIVLASERRLTREEKPMDYRSFVAERARAGDPGAQRVLEELAPVRIQRVEPQRKSREVSLHGVRLRLDVIRAEEEARYELARGQRERLQRLAQPAKLDDVLAAERKRIEKQAADTTQFSEAQRARLTQIAKQKRSWNPLTRAAASREEQSLHATRRSRFETAVTEAVREFERSEVPQIAHRIAADERRYRQYCTESLALEDQKHEAQWLLRKQIPHVEHQLSVLERAGTSKVELSGDTSRASFNQLAVAVDQQYNALSETLRREAERSIRREQRDRDWSRDMSMMR
jgi:hypothetical protein